MKKIILSNLLIFFFLFCIVELASYLYIKYNAKEYMDNYNKAAKEANLTLLTQRYAPIRIIDQDKFDNWRAIDYGDKDKPSILFFGCSYIYGFLNDQNETLPYYITERTGRTTVNRGVPGGCILNMFHDLRSETFYNQIKDIPEPDYVIYMWINDHLNRIANPYTSTVTCVDCPFYEVKPDWEYKDGKLVEIPIQKWKLPFYALYCSKAWHYLYAEKFAFEDRNSKMLRYFITARNICKDKFPKAEFIIIEYKDGSFSYMRPELKNALKKENIRVFNAEDLAGHELENDKWRANDQEHPNGKAFSDIADGLIKQLKL